MKTIKTILYTVIVFALTSCTESKPAEVEIASAPYVFSENGVDVVFNPLQTKSNGESDTQSFTMVAEDASADIYLTSIVTSTVIGSTYTRLEQYTVNNVFVGAMLIHGDSIVQVEYNPDILDSDLGAPATKGAYSRCVGEKYKTLSDVIESDGQSKLLCDGLNILQLCNAAKLVSSVVICIRNGK